MTEKPPQLNRYSMAKKAEASSQDAKKRFSAVRSPQIARIANQANEPRKRPNNWKGERKMLSVRLSAVLIEDLGFLAFASAIPQGEICEEGLRQTVDTRLAALRDEFGDHELQMLRTLYERQRIG